MRRKGGLSATPDRGSPVRRNPARTARRVVSPERPADAGDRPYIAYLPCGPERAQADSAVRHAMIAREAGGTEPTVLAFPAEKVPATGGHGPFRTGVRLQFDAFMLKPGRYPFMVSRGGGERFGEAPCTIR